MTVSIAQAGPNGRAVGFRARDGLLVNFGITNNLVTLDLSQGQPNHRYVIECTTDLSTWFGLTPVRLSSGGAFRYEYTSTEPKCFYRVVDAK